MDMKLCSATKAEVSFMDKEKREWKYPVDLESRTCSCRQWQITRLPCIHALFFITTLSGPAGNIQQYVHEHYSVARFKETYAVPLPALEGKHQWDVVDPRFKLCALVLKRAAGRPRKSRYKPRSERAGLRARKRKCTRCGGSSHFGKYCDNAVDSAFGEYFDENDDDQQPIGTDDEHDVTDDPNDDDHLAPNDGDHDAPNYFAHESANDFDHEIPNDFDHEAPNGDPDEAPTDGDHDDHNDAPNDGSQHSVVVSSA